MLRKWILTFLALFFSITTFAASKAVVLNIKGVIGPATEDYIVKNLKLAENQHAQFVILEINTPGGLETSMTSINDAILSSRIPVITYVAPAGARAASAGTYIMYASHLAVMAPGTHMGAATPVSFAHTGMRQLTTSEKKAINDSSAYLISLARMSKRNELWAQHAVIDSNSIPAEEAKRLNVVEEIAKNYDELLQKINKRTVTVQGQNVTLDTNNITLEHVNTDWRYAFLSFITHPNLIYLLFLVAIYGIFFELSNPGLIFPGVAGIISLLLVLYAFQLMPVNYTGFTLILAGLTFMALEVYVTSYGVLGLGGIIAFIIGSLMLFDGRNPYYHLTLSLIFVMSFASFIFFYVLLQLAIQSHKKAIVTGKEGLIGSEGIVIGIRSDKIIVRVLGEIWEASTKEPLHMGQKVVVKACTGLVLQVTPAYKS